MLDATEISTMLGAICGRATEMFSAGTGVTAYYSVNNYGAHRITLYPPIGKALDFEGADFFGCLNKVNAWLDAEYVGNLAIGLSADGMTVTELGWSL